MIDWTPEAQEYLDGYLKQVGALARRQGDDAEDIVSGLRDHITNELESAGKQDVDLDSLLAVLANMGTPEEVVSSDIPLRVPVQPEAPNAQASPPPPLQTPLPPLQPATQTVIVKRKSWLGCAVATLIAAILIPVGLAILGVISAITIPALTRSREAAHRASCAGNLKQIYQALYAYAEEDDGAFPPLSKASGTLMFNANALTETMLSNTGVFECPSDKENNNVKVDHAGIVPDDYSYYYISHAITNEAEGLVFVDAYKKAMETGTNIGDFRTADDIIIQRLRLKDLSTGGFTIEASQVPVLIEKPGHHIPGGSNVLFLDGHVEFIRDNQNKFPLTKAFMEALDSIDR